jgi:type IV pilus assembly protein PilA
MMLKNSKGFTLVEVIVVAVIVAVLAAVAIPLYLNYVNSSRSNAAANTGGAVATFCGSCANASGTLTPTLNAGGGGTLACASTSMGNTSMQIPADIVVTITTGTPNVVTAKHKDSPSTEAAKSYNY